jgi:hypothetical protein
MCPLLPLFYFGVPTVPTDCEPNVPIYMTIDDCDEWDFHYNDNCPVKNFLFPKLEITSWLLKFG